MRVDRRIGITSMRACRTLAAHRPLSWRRSVTFCHSSSNSGESSSDIHSKWLIPLLQYRTCSIYEDGVEQDEDEEEVLQVHPQKVKMRLRSK